MSVLIDLSRNIVDISSNTKIYSGAIFFGLRSFFTSSVLNNISGFGITSLFLLSSISSLANLTNSSTFCGILASSNDVLTITSIPLSSKYLTISIQLSSLNTVVQTMYKIVFFPVHSFKILKIAFVLPDSFFAQRNIEQYNLGIKSYPLI